MEKPESDIYQIFIMNLKTYCKKQNVDLEKLAKQSRISYARLKAILGGKSQRIHLTTLGRIANALGITYDSLLK